MVIRFLSVKRMKLYSYVVKEDTGFAPNPFHGYCTLACCKPKIRKKAKEGDWIVGLTSKDKGKGNKIVFFMEVGEVLTFDEYWKKFKQKRPKLNAGIIQTRGDNIYEPRKGFSYGYRQLRSMHSGPKPLGKSENEGNKTRDLKSTTKVLVATKFAYFGSDAIPLPESLQALKIGRAYRCNFSPEEKEAFLEFADEQKLGVHAPPKRWKKDDGSWEDAACGIGAGAG